MKQCALLEGQTSKSRKDEVLQLREQISTVQRYLGSEFPGLGVRPSPVAKEGKKTKSELDYIATVFQVGGTQHALHVSDLILEDLSPDEVLRVLREFRVGDELRQAGKQPLVVTTKGVLLILEWLGPHPLTEGDIREHSPGAGGVYILAEPLEAGHWRPYLVDRGKQLSSEVQLFARQDDLGRVRGFFCAVIETDNQCREIVCDRVVKFLAKACNVDDLSTTTLPPLPVNLPPQLLA